MAKRSKKYQKAKKLVEEKDKYPLEKALELLPEVNTSSFKGAAELHINLNFNKKQLKENTIKGSLTLPNQVGDPVKIAVVTTPKNQEKAKKADTVGGEELIKKIEDGWMEFDVLIATPDIMQKLAKLGPILGPKGKMPNPKNETVTKDVDRVIENYKKGKTDFRMDEKGGVHKKIGNVDMEKEKLEENIEAFIKAVLEEAKKVKPVPFESIFLSPSMGPSIPLDEKEYM